ncbi:membrane-targeted effector domain-containing toxin [Stenotrophomonas sp. AB1(2024)]|uniref:membrane-targeted effector domain-containing toxin n=1 Tax=Stenotrophomonas sp. AB1(2024) TaxID=3132215 RepID=UPI0030981BAA
MLDALSALMHRVTSPATAVVQRRNAAPALLSLRNLPDSPPAQTRNAAVFDGVVCQRPTPPDPLERFALPSGQGQTLVALLQRHRRVLDPDYHLPFAPPERAALDSFFARRAQLADDALGTPLPPRAERDPWPGLAPVRTHAQLLRQLLDGRKGLVIGEVHAARAGKTLLIDHMPLLRHLGVDTLYLQHLQGDIHQADLDKLHRTGVVSPALGRFLAEQDHGHMTDAASGATFRNLVDAAFNAGIRVVALDLMTSYHLRGIEDEVGPSASSTTEIRIKVANHVAIRRIEHDQRNQVGKPGPQRWVALVGNAHAGSFNGISGIAERLGVPSLRVEDTSPSWSSRPQAGCDPGRTVQADFRRDGGQLQCDYLLKVPAADGRARPETPAPCTAAEALRLREVRQAICALPEARSA